MCLQNDIKKGLNSGILMKIFMRGIGFFLLVIMPIITNAQLRLHTDMVLHSTIIFEPYMPKKVPNIGVKLGATYPLNRSTLLDVSAAYYHFGEKTGNLATSSSIYYSSNTQIHLYTSSNAFVFEPCFQLFIVPNLIYFKTGYYLGMSQIQSDSGTFRETYYTPTSSQSFLHNDTSFNYRYSKGLDRGMLFGTGLCVRENKKVNLNIEVLFRIGSVNGTKSNLLTNEVVLNKRVFYFAFCPIFRISVKVGK
jgi:hypothetical protein